jgi:hypothetical protein
MSEFLLLGARPPRTGELSPGRAAHDVAALAAWHRWLRRWGLLRSFALPHDSMVELRACLIVQASGYPAAKRLAEGWGRMSGYQVTVLPLRSAAVGEGHGR